MSGLLTITYIQSVSGSNKQQRANLRALGFTKLQQKRVLADTPIIRGMIKKVEHLLRVEMTSVTKKE